MKSEPSVTLKDELLSRGYTLSRQRLDRQYTHFYTPTGKRVLTKGAFYDYPFMTQFAKTVSKDKTLSYDFAEQHGVTIPATIQTDDRQKAGQFLELHKRVVVKPADLGGGRGLTVDVTDQATLDRAIQAATSVSAQPLIQQQFIGQEIRVTVIEGVASSAILRQTARVTGDDVRTVQQLIEAENEQRSTLDFPLITYPLLAPSNIPVDLMESQTVPMSGEVVELNRSTMIRGGASFYEVLDDVDVSYLRIAEKLADALNPAMVVVDLMVEDFTRPATETNYIFLEFNTAPNLEIYSALRGGSSNVIVRLADLVDDYAQLCG